MDFETRAIHAGQEPDPATGAIVTPIYQTSTYVQEEVGKHKGYDYARVANPTRTALETCLASLEGAEFGLAYSSGLGATTTAPTACAASATARMSTMLRFGFVGVSIQTSRVRSSIAPATSSALAQSVR